MMVKRLEHIVQERNKTEEGQVSQVTPGGDGDVIERLQQIVKYKICTIVITRHKAPEEEQIFQENTTQSRDLSPHLPGEESVEEVGESHDDPPPEP